MLSWSRAAPGCRAGQAPGKRIVVPGGPCQYYAVHQYFSVRRVWGASGVYRFLIFAPPTPPQNLIAGILSAHVRCNLAHSGLLYRHYRVQKLRWGTDDAFPRSCPVENLEAQDTPAKNRLPSSMPQRICFANSAFDIIIRQMGGCNCLKSIQTTRFNCQLWHWEPERQPLAGHLAR